MKAKMIPSIESSPICLITSFSDVVNSPLSFFLLPQNTLWSFKRKADDGNEQLTYQWAMAVINHNNREELTLRLYGPGVGLISSLKSVQTDSSITKIESTETINDSETTFIIRLEGNTRQRRSNYYDFRIISHFNEIDMSSVLDPKLFHQSHGLRDRKQRIADLSLLELYQSAYAYCTFTQNKSLDETDAYRQRCKMIKENLLLIENILEDDCKSLEQNLDSKDNKKHKQELLKYLLTTEIIQRDNGDRSSLETQLTNERNHTSTNICTDASLTLKFIRIADEIERWCPSILSTPAQQQSLKTTVPSSVESIKHVKPRLITMNIVLLDKFRKLLSGTEIDELKIGLATVSGLGIGAITSIALDADLEDGLKLTSAMGELFFTVSFSYEVLKDVPAEYTKVLEMVAKSMGIRVDEVPIHQYCLEEKISDLFQKISSTVANINDIVDNWKRLFPRYWLSKVSRPNEKKFYLAIVKIIDANFRIRDLVSEDFALGIIGPGKSGKSTVGRTLFGFNTNPHKEDRTTHLQCYHVNNKFQMLDFPHMTAVSDNLADCFSMYQNLIDAIIVVLNAEQGGNDERGEGYVVKTVTESLKSDVDVLFCFNKCDRLAFREAKKPNKEYVDRFAALENGSLDLTSNNNEDEYWTEGHAEQKRLEWAGNYGISPEKCWITFCDLEQKDGKKASETLKRLKSIKLRTYQDIKNIWLKDVLDKHSFSKQDIDEIMKFCYQRK